MSADTAAPTGLVHCGRCQRSSTWAAAFARVATFSGPRLLCPRCLERRQMRKTYQTWAWAVATLVLVPLGIGMELLSATWWLVMGWAAVVISMYLSVLPHELGHALMARAVGYRPLAIVWGGYPAIYDGRIFGIRTVIGLAPESGLAFFEPTDDRWPRLKHAAINAAGPMVNASLAALALTAAFAIGESYTRSPLVFVLLAIGIGNAVLAVVNLWPHGVPTIAGLLPSDGARLLQAAEQSRVDLPRHRIGASQIRVFFAFRDEDHEQVLVEAAAAEAIAGPAPWIDVARAASLCCLDRPVAARELLHRALQMPALDTDPATRALAENNFAWANLIIDDPADDADSLARSARAIEVLPWFAALVNTRACVLAAWATPGSARLAEARALLERIGELEQSSQSRRASVLATGLIAAAEGDFDEAQRQREALRAFSQPGLAERVLEARIPSR